MDAGSEDGRALLDRRIAKSPALWGAGLFCYYRLVRGHGEPVGAVGDDSLGVSSTGSKGGAGSAIDGSGRGRDGDGLSGRILVDAVEATRLHRGTGGNGDSNSTGRAQD